MEGKDMAFEANGKTQKSTGRVTYWYGDAARYTGKSEMIHGRRFYELVLLEGHRKGECVVTYHEPKEGK